MNDDEKVFITPKIEKRQYRRAALVVEVRCTSTSRETMYLTRDISAGGVFVSAADPFPAGSEVRVALRFSAGSPPSHYTGKVVHSLPGIGMGIEFQNIEAGALKTLQKFVDEAP